MVLVLRPNPTPAHPHGIAVVVCFARRGILIDQADDMAALGFFFRTAGLLDEGVGSQVTVLIPSNTLDLLAWVLVVLSDVQVLQYDASLTGAQGRLLTLLGNTRQFVSARVFAGAAEGGGTEVTSQLLALPKCLGALVKDGGSGLLEIFNGACEGRLFAFDIR